jgi:serine phosphatase RsbU (regulator of sigma subunit)
MEDREVGRWSLRKVWCHQWGRVISLLTLPMVLLVFDVLTPPTVRFGPLMVATPMLAAVFCGPVEVALVAAGTLVCVAVAAGLNLQLYAINFPVQLTAMVFIILVAMAASAVRQRREKELALSRRVAETTQRVLLRPPPRRIGSLTISTLYLASDEEATIGGDLYAAADIRPVTRVMVGDVQGKGLEAVETMSYLLGAFRGAARSRVPLPALVPYLERSLREEMEAAADAAARTPDIDRSAERRLREGFVTAVVVDVPEEGNGISVVNRGHPPPLIVHQDKVRSLEAVVPCLPLGLGELDKTVSVDTFDFAPGDTLLLYTDGVIEARDPAGVFYPLASRLRRWTSLSPDALLEAIRTDLLQYVHGSLGDDVALVAVQRAA